MKKHFLLLLMAFMSLTGWAVDLVGSQFQIGNVTYSENFNPVLVDDGIYVDGTDYTIDLTKWYTDEACTIQAKDGEGTPYTISTLPVAKYWVKITGMGTYAGLTASSSFNVIAIAATISFDAAQTKEWNTEEPATYTYTLTKKGNPWGDADAATKLGLTVGRVAGEDVATYNYTFDWTNKNYALTRPAANEAVKFAITAKDLSASATITALKTTMVYTGKNATGIYKVMDGTTELVEGTDWTMAATKDVSAGNTPLITFAGNYTGTKAPTTAFAITKAPITVSIDDIEVTYNGADQKDQTLSADLKFNYSGIVGEDLADAATIKAAFTAPTTVAVATAATNVGTYTLELSNDGNTGIYENYEFKTWVPGTLTINPKEVKIKAADKTKNIGAADPTFTYVATPALVAGHEVTGITYTRESGETAGEYAITPNLSAAKVIVTATSADVSSNYDLKVDDTKGVLTIGKAGIIVLIKDAEKAYGAADPTFTYKAVGLAEGDEDKLVVNITREKAGTAEGEAVGSYVLTATAANPDATKYSGVTIYDGIFTINRAKLTFVIPAQNIALGKTAADLVALKKNITVTGVNNSDDKASLYDLGFGVGVSLDTEDKTYNDETVDGGLVATLTAAAQVNYVVDDASDTYVDATSAAGKLIVGTGTVAAITFNSVDADYATITGQAGETQDVALKIDNRTREVPAGTAHTWAAQTWNAMVLPFEVTVGELSAQLGYAIVNRVNPEKTTEGNVVFKLEMDKIPANEPFCVKTTDAIADGTTINFIGKKIVAPGSEYPSVDAGQGYKFVGVYKGFTIDKTKSLFYFLRGDNTKWANIGSTSANTWNMVPFDAYIDQSGAASARELTFTFEEIDGTKTAIKSVEVGMENSSVKTGWYTIGGVKLQGAPTQKGIYINNGKKVIIK
jgi:hypothetical protein